VTDSPTDPPTDPPLPGTSALELWLVRHGQTVANQRAQFSGHSDVALTAQGVAEARALRPLVRGVSFQGVWSSDLQRAVRTARLAWGEPQVDRRLREMDFGDLEGRRWDELEPELAEALLAFDDFEAPGGETLAELSARVDGFLAELPAGRHLLVTHGGVVRLLTRRLGMNRFLPNTVVVALDWTAQQVLFVREPDTDVDTDTETPPAP